MRNQIFAENYKFKSEEVAIEYMESVLIKINETSKIEEEKINLKVAKPPLELAEIRESTVDKYSSVKIENNSYSVPEYLVGMKVTSKIYYNKIMIYSNYEFVCEHKKIDGENKISADIRHYLKTLSRKPGALRNSYVLKSNPNFKKIYYKYYMQNSKEFIQIIQENKEKSNKDIEKILVERIIKLPNDSKKQNVLNDLARNQTSMYNNIMNGVVNG